MKNEFPVLEEPGMVLHLHADDTSTIYIRMKDICPECNQEQLILNGRCKTCTYCGWSSCDL